MWILLHTFCFLIMKSLLTALLYSTVILAVALVSLLRHQVLRFCSHFIKGKNYQMTLMQLTCKISIVSGTATFYPQYIWLVTYGNYSSNHMKVVNLFMHEVYISFLFMRKTAAQYTLEDCSVWKCVYSQKCSLITLTSAIHVW